MEYRDYIISDRRFRIKGKDLMAAVAAMPGFAIFEAPTDIPELDVTCLFSIDCQENPPAAAKCLYRFDADGVHSSFCLTSDGYLLEMVRPEDLQTLRIWCAQGGNQVHLEGSLEPQLLRFALWMAFGWMTVYTGRIALHCSCIVNDGKAYIFLGESGTGKSTHTRLWGQYIPGSHLLNDDSPILAVDGLAEMAAGEESSTGMTPGVFIYGSPWSGKTPCYRQERFPLGGVVRLSQAPFNKMKKLSRLQALAAIHPSCPPDFAYDDYLYGGIVKTLNIVLAQVPFYHLDCLPDEAAAKLSWQMLTGQIL